MILTSHQPNFLPYMGVIYKAYGTSSTYVPEASDYKQKNIIVTSRQKVLIDEKRIEVSFSEDS